MAKRKEEKKGKSNEEIEPIEDKKEDKEDDIITKNKMNVSDFIRKERISPWAARVFMKTLDKEEYTEIELKKLYKDFVDEGKKEDNNKGVKK